MAATVLLAHKAAAAEEDTTVSVPFIGNASIIEAVANAGFEQETSNDQIMIVGEQFMASVPIIVYDYPKPKYLIYGPSAYLKLGIDTDPRTAGQCVNYIKAVTDFEYSGNAIYWKNYITSQTPTVGSVVVLNASKWGHVGVVIKVTDTTITVRSRNWRGLWIVSDDVFDRTDIRILGYVDR